MHLIMEHTHRKGSSHHHKHKGHRTNSAPASGSLSPRIEAPDSAAQDAVIETTVFIQNVINILLRSSILGQESSNYKLRLFLIIFTNLEKYKNKKE